MGGWVEEYLLFIFLYLQINFFVNIKKIGY